MAQTGNIYNGLWYPIIFAAITFVIGMLFVKETKDVNIYALVYRHLRPGLVCPRHQSNHFPRVSACLLLGRAGFAYHLRIHHLVSTRYYMNKLDKEYDVHEGEHE